MACGHPSILLLLAPQLRGENPSPSLPFEAIWGGWGHAIGINAGTFVFLRFPHGKFPYSLSPYKQTDVTKEIEKYLHPYLY